MTAALQLDVFAQRSAARHGEAIAALAPLAAELARAAGRDGITVADLRVEAQRRGLMPRQNTHDRTKSYLGAVMRAAALVPTERTRRADPKKYPELAHLNANRHVVWIAPEFALDGVA